MNNSIWLLVRLQLSLMTLFLTKLWKSYNPFYLIKLKIQNNGLSDYIRICVLQYSRQFVFEKQLCFKCERKGKYKNFHILCYCIFLKYSIIWVTDFLVIKLDRQSSNHMAAVCSFLKARRQETYKESVCKQFSQFPTRHLPN